jgi:hypothetical protein
MAILVNKPSSVAADSTTSLQINKNDLQSLLVYLGASDYWKDQNTWKAAAFLFENAQKQRTTVTFDFASGVNADLKVDEYFVNGNILCKKIIIIGFANDSFTIFRSNFITTTEFDIGVTGGYVAAPIDLGVETPELIPNGNFEQGDLNWFFNNTNQTNKWVIGTATAFSGTKSLYVSQDNGLTATYNNTVGSESYAWTHINVSDTKPKIRIRMRVAGEEQSQPDYWDFLNLSVNYNPSNLSDASTLLDPTPGTLGGGMPFSSALIIFTPDYQNSWVFYEFDLTGVITGTVNVRLIFRWVNDTLIGSGFGAAIDSIEVVGENPPVNPLTWTRLSGHTTEPDGGVYGGTTSNYWIASNQVIPSGQDGEFTFKMRTFYNVPVDFAFGVGPLSDGVTNAYFGVCRSGSYLKVINGNTVLFMPVANFSVQGLGRNVIKIARQGSLMKITVNGLPFYEVSVGTEYQGELVAAVRTKGSSVNSGLVAAYKSI